MQRKTYLRLNVVLKLHHILDLVFSGSRDTENKYFYLSSLVVKLLSGQYGFNLINMVMEAFSSHLLSVSLQFEANSLPRTSCPAPPPPGPLFTI